MNHCLTVSTVCIIANKSTSSITIIQSWFIEIDCILFLFIFICNSAFYKYYRHEEFILSFTLTGPIFFPFRGCLVLNIGNHWF